ncbi:transposon Ty3-G Gag-Pol polyprotein [Trichonephila clavipes]|nr:transposon Ty3-G Gag-Pol polyprotein [Trichonephila clavipes]
MKQRAESLNVDNKLMMELFFQHLPSLVQTILAAVSDLTLNKAVDIADQILEVSRSPIETFAVYNKNEQSLESKLFREIEKLNERIDCFFQFLVVALHTIGTKIPVKGVFRISIIFRFAGFTGSSENMSRRKMRSTMHIAGKQIQQRIMATYSLPKESRSLFIRDWTTNISFLIDTGSDVSLIPANVYQKRNASQQTLFATNSSTINVYGQKTLTLNFNLRDFMWTFLIADIQYIELLKEFPFITKLPNLNQPVKHNTVHHITTKGPPVVAKRRRLAPNRLKIAKTEFQNMMHLGHLRAWKSNYASPLHMVPKKGTLDWRPVGYYRALNSQTFKDKYPIPCIADFTAELHGSKISIRIDLVKAYHQAYLFLEGHTNQKKSHSSVRKSSEPLTWNENAEQAFLCSEKRYGRSYPFKTSYSRGLIEPMGTFSLPDARFSHIHIDIVGPLPPSEGHHYLLMIIDPFSRLPEAIPIPDMQAKTICRAIFDTLISHFGCPSVIT